MKKKQLLVAALLFTMRMTLVQFALTISFVASVFANNTEAQSVLEKKITLSVRNAEIIKVIEDLQKETKANFSYSANKIKANRPITFSVNNKRLMDFLEEIFKPLGIGYKVEDEQILLYALKDETSSVIIKKNHLQALNNYFQAYVITGIVTNENGEYLSGASINIKNTSKYTVTNSRGEFAIEAEDENSTVVVSFTGYAPKEVKVGNSKILNISLVASNKALDEVVVIGYGKVKKSDVTGSVSKVGEQSIKATPIVAIDRAIQGRVSGVQVTTNSARPGGSTTIRIRGTGSVNASSEPLYVIDGYPTGDLNSINPNDVESMEILKDASATAIYGSRGSNGVVLITTKRGKNGQSNLEFDTYYGTQSVRRKLELLNAREYAEFVNEARINGGSTAYFNGSSADRPLPSSFGEGTDWQDQIFRKAPIQSYQLTLSGGEQKTRYAVSASLYDQAGVLINSRFKRYTIRTNLDHDISSRVKMGLSMQGAYINSDRTRTEADANRNAGVTTAAMNYPAIFPVYNADGTYFKDQTSLSPFPVDNPVAISNLIQDKFYTTRFLTNVYADIKLTEGLTFRTTLGANLLNNKNNYYVSRQLLLSSLIGNASVNSSLSTSWLTENTLNYTKTLAEKHSINAVAGYTYQAFRFEGATANAANFNSDFASFNNLAAGATLQSPSSSVSESALISYLARVNYGFDNRYLVTLTARRDGSSRFGPSNKFGFFPSGAIAWKASNEKFFANQKTFSDVKFRASYGLTGNQEIGDYQFLSSLRVGSYVFGGTAGSVSVGSVPSGVSNLDLRWEKNAQFDVGVDFGILKNRISVTIDYYNKKTSDLLFLVNIPSSTGYFNSLKNVGSVENKGWEFDVNTVNVNNKNFRWNTNVNFSINKNSVLELDGRPEFTAGLGSGDLQISNPILLKVGEPLGNFYGRIMEGIFQNQGEIDKSAQKTAKPGDIKYSDIDGNGIINDNDRAIIGNAYPKYFGGLDNTISFRNFDLNIFWQGSFGNKILNLSRFELYGLNGQNAAKEIVDRWTPTNPSNTIPRANSAGGQKILSTFQIEDGSYLRLKNLSLGYNLPQTVLRSIALKSAKIYVSAQNLATITKYKGYDPEVSRHGNNSISQGMDLGAYPTAKTILVGAVIKF